MKQRLVGTVVLGSLALIIIPLLLDGEGVESPPLALDMPAPPPIDTAPLPEPVRPLILADTLEVASEDENGQASDQGGLEPASAGQGSIDAEAAAEPAPAAASPTETVATDESRPALDALGLPEAWTVRLGIFAERGNAEQLLARLLGAGHKAYLREVSTGQGTLNGIFVCEPLAPEA